MNIKDSILDTIGGTPLVRLSRIGAGLTPQLVAKVESFNPGGSIKDRVAVALIEAAERDGLLRAGRDDRRADVGQHGNRTGDRRAAEGLSRDRGDAGQDVAREDRPAARVRRRGGRVPDRRRAGLPAVLLLGRRPAHGARSRARSSPTSTRTPPTRRRTTDTTGPELWGQTRRADHPPGRAASAPAARSPAPRATCKEQQPDLVVIGADPAGSIYSAATKRRQAVPGRGRGRGLLAGHVRSVGGRSLGHGERPRSFLTRVGSRGPRGSWRGLVRHGACTPRCEVAARDRRPRAR